MRQTSEQTSETIGRDGTRRPLDMGFDGVLSAVLVPINSPKACAGGRWLGNNAKVHPGKRIRRKAAQKKDGTAS